MTTYEVDHGPVFPAKLFPEIGDSIVQVVVGADLLLNAEVRKAGSNDALEEFRDDAVHFECYDSDFNFLATIARYPLRSTVPAVQLLPVMIEQAKLLFPGHVQADRLAARY